MTPNQNSLSFDKNFVANGINKPDKVAMLYNISGGYPVLTFLIDAITGSKSRQVVGPDGKIEKALMGNGPVITLIGSNVASGTNLKVYFSSPSYDMFVLKKVVLDSNRNQGRVISKGAGYVIIEPTPATPTFNASTMFIGGMFIKAGWDASGNYGSTTPQPTYQTPYFDYNYTSITRGGTQYFARNESSTWVDGTKGGFWYSSIDVLAAQMYSKELEHKAWHSFRGQTLNSAVEGTVNHNGGLLWAIKDPIRGGYVQTMYNNPTANDYVNFALNIAKRQALGETTQTWFVGQGALANIQLNFTQPYVQYGGDANTFGGKEVKGLDVRMFQIAGVMVKLIPCPYFNDPEYWPELSTIPGVQGTKMDNTVVAVDTGMYPSMGAGMQPAMERIHFGAQEMSYGYLNGIGMGNTAASTMSLAGQTWGQIVTDRDSLEFVIKGDGGIDCIAYRMGIMELGA